VGAHDNEFALQAGVVEEGGLLLKQRLNLRVAEAEAHEGPQGFVDDFGPSFDAFTLREWRSLLHGVPAADLCTQKALFFQFLVGFADGVEGDVQLVPKGSS
jgi:hypothetical protein